MGWLIRVAREFIQADAASRRSSCAERLDRCTGAGVADLDERPRRRPLADTDGSRGSGKRVMVDPPTPRREVIGGPRVPARQSSPSSCASSLESADMSSFTETVAASTTPSPTDSRTRFDHAITLGPNCLRSLETVVRGGQQFCPSMRGIGHVLAQSLLHEQIRSPLDALASESHVSGDSCHRERLVKHRAQHLPSRSCKSTPCCQAVGRMQKEAVQPEDG